MLCLHWGAHWAPGHGLGLAPCCLSLTSLALISKVISQHCQAAGLKGALLGRVVCWGWRAAGSFFPGPTLFLAVNCQYKLGDQWGTGRETMTAIEFS